MNTTDSKSELVIEAADLSVSYRGSAALTGVSLKIPKGASLAVIGPNGSGKSTFLRAVAALAEFRGELRVEARETPHGVAVVLQRTDVDDLLPIEAREVVALGRYGATGIIRRFSKADHQAVQDSLDRVGAGDLASHQYSELSGGQQQRVLVAQGLAQEADLLLLDEPFTGVDFLSRSRILAAMAAECDAGRTVVVTTHDLADADSCDLVLLLATRQIAFGPPSEVLVEEHLSEAFGERVLHTVDGTLVVDDPHHDHSHG